MSGVLIVGPGYVGGALGVALASRGTPVWGVSRSGLAPDRIVALRGDVADPDGLRRSLAALPAELDALIYALSAGELSDEAYRRAYVTGLQNTLSALADRPVGRLLFTSSTAVYAQTDGGWVDERSATQPASFAARRMLEAEAVAASAPMTAVVVRLAGIYGPGRTSLVDRVAAGTKIAGPSAGHANRIHRADCVGVLSHLLTLPHPPPLVVAADDDPAPLAEVEAWLCAQLGRDVAALQPSPRAPRRAFSDKRCRNALLRGTGYAFVYPSYRDGYSELLPS